MGDSRQHRPAPRQPEQAIRRSRSGRSGRDGAARAARRRERAGEGREATAGAGRGACLSVQYQSRVRPSLSACIQCVLFSRFASRSQPEYRTTDSHPSMRSPGKKVSKGSGATAAPADRPLPAAEVLAELERTRPEAFTSAQIVDAFPSRCARLTEASFRKWVQRAAVPHPPRGRKGGTRSSAYRPDPPPHRGDRASRGGGPSRDRGAALQGRDRGPTAARGLPDGLPESSRRARSSRRSVRAERLEQVRSSPRAARLETLSGRSPRRSNARRSPRIRRRHSWGRRAPEPRRRHGNEAKGAAGTSGSTWAGRSHRRGAAGRCGPRRDRPRSRPSR